MDAPDQVRDAPEHSRYEIVRDGEVIAIADYRIDGDVMVLPHTVVEAHLRGHGLGDRLVRAVLDDVRSRGLTVVPQCWFVAEFIERNPEFGDLVAA